MTRFFSDTTIGPLLLLLLPFCGKTGCQYSLETELALLWLLNCETVTFCEFWTKWYLPTAFNKQLLMLPAIEEELTGPFSIMYNYENSSIIYQHHRCMFAHRWFDVNAVTLVLHIHTQTAVPVMHKEHQEPLGGWSWGLDQGHLLGQPSRYQTS